MKNSILFFCLIHIFCNLNAMEMADKKNSQINSDKDEEGSPSQFVTAPESNKATTSKETSSAITKDVKPKKHIQIVKMHSKSEGSSTDWLEKVHDRNKETFTSLKRRFLKLKYAVSYDLSPLELLNPENDTKIVIKSAVSEKELREEIDDFAYSRKELYKKRKWVKSEKNGVKAAPPTDNFFKVWEEALDVLYEPNSEKAKEEENKRKEREKECQRIFIQKKVFPANTNVHIFPDIHGDVKSLIKVLETFKDKGIISDELKLADHQAIICLGDYSDEGIYSTEVWYTLLHLANLNPDNFFLCRGQHEHLSENFTCLKGELERKYDIDWFKESEEKQEKEKRDQQADKHIFESYYKGHIDKRPPSRKILEKMTYLYRLLPVAFFFGKKDKNEKNYVDFICASHAGLEVGWQGHRELLGNDADDAYQWLDTIDRSGQIEKLPTPIRQEINSLAQDGYHDNLAAEIHTKEKVPVSDIRNIKLNKTIYNLGFCYNDYQIEGDKKIGYNQGTKTWSWSKALTEAVMNLWNNKSRYRTILMWLNWPLRKLFGWGFNNPTYSVVANIRGHQHSYDYSKGKGDLMIKLVQHKGVYKMWDDNKEMQETITMTPGTVASLLCLGADNQYAYPFQVMEKKKEKKNEKGGNTYFIPFRFATVATLTFNAAKTAWELTRNKIQIFGRYDTKAYGLDPHLDTIIDKLN